MLIFGLEIFNILLWNLNITLELKNVNEILSFVCEFLFEVVNLFSGAWVFKFRDHIEEHRVFVWLFHYLSNFVIQILEKRSCWMVDNIKEWLKTNTSLTNISVEKSDTNDNIG